VKAQRTIAFETPTGWQPPPQWQPPQQFGASSQAVLTYRKSGSMAGMVVFIVVISVLVMVGGIAASVLSTVTTTTREVTKVHDQVELATKQANDAIAQALAQASAAQGQADDMLGRVPESAKGQPSLSPLTNAGVKQVLAAYKETSGTSRLQLKRLTLHDTHSSAEIQSPKNPNHMDRYDYHSGRMRGPDPVRLMGGEKSNLTAHLFDPEKTPLTDLESLKITAMGKLANEEAKITHVIVERDRGKVVVRMYGGNKRESGYVAFYETGRVTRVSR
jgi:hypothetical protein